MNMIHGFPDDLKVLARYDDSGVLRLTRPGTPSFLDQIEGERRFTDVWLGPGTPRRSQFAPAPTVNYIADPDISGEALQAAARLSQAVAVPWFNHPTAVLANTRDRLAEALDGLTGVTVPRTIRLGAPTRNALVETLEENGLRYPVILRSAGHHGGTSTLLIRVPADLDTHHAGWAGRQLYVSQYLECRSPDGLYRKHRIAVVGGTPYLRHLIIGSSWMLSAGSRLDRPAVRAEEAAVLSRFSAGFSDRLVDTTRRIAGRLGLDYFGMDCLVLDDDRIVIFEANPTMNILLNSAASPNMWDDPIARIRAALLDHIDHPNRWLRSDGRPGPAPSKT